MAHNLAVRNGRVAMVYQGATPWHQLGTRIQGDEGLDDALIAAGLDFDVTTGPLFTTVDGAELPVPSHKVIIHEGHPLAVVGAGYNPIQYRQAFEPLRPMLENHGCSVAAAGLLGQGERAWVLVKLPSDADVTVNQGDDVRGYALAFTGHDGKTAAMFKPTPIRVVCQNTLDAAAYKGANLMHIRHTLSAPAKLDAAGKVLDGMVATMKESGATFVEMAAQMMDQDQITDFIQELIPVPEKGDSPVLRTRRDTIARLVFHGKGADLTGARIESRQATAWSVYNAITEYVDHVRPGEAKSTSGVLRANVAAVQGAGAKMKLQAFTMARELVAA